jgi:hypothetical protein
VGGGELVTDYRNFPPVPPVEKPAAYRQSLLRHADHCMRSAYLSLKYGEDGPARHELIRGTAVHRVAERMMRDWMQQGETYGSGAQISEMTGGLVDEVLSGSPDLPLREVDADAVRQMAYHLAVGMDVPPQMVIGVERPFETVVRGEKLTATVDLLYEIDGETLGIIDYKSSFGVPAQEDFRTHFYGFQLRFYSWIATLELGKYRRVVARCLFPRYLNGEGRVTERVLELDKQRLQEFGWDMDRLVGRMDQAFKDLSFDDGDWREGQDWPAVPGDHCAYCPCEPECPIPVHLRDWQGAIQSVEQARETAMLWDRSGSRLKGAQRALRQWVEVHGPLEFGGWMLDLDVSESRGVKRVNGRAAWDEMAAALESGSFRREDWIRVTSSTRLVKVAREKWLERTRTGFEGED